MHCGGDIVASGHFPIYIESKNAQTIVLKNLHKIKILTMFPAIFSTSENDIWSFDGWTENKLWT